MNQDYYHQRTNINRNRQHDDSDFSETFREQQRTEAKRRMDIMGIPKRIIHQFIENGIVMVAEPYGFYRFLTDKEEDEIKAFENEHNAVVYMVVNVGTEENGMKSMLFVSQFSEEWPSDKTDVKSGRVYTYTINRADASCCEYGAIGYTTTKDGCVLRIS